MSSIKAETIRDYINNPNIKTKTKLMQEADYIVLMHCQKYKKYNNYEDLLQEGRYALLQSLETLDVSNSTDIVKSAMYWMHCYTKLRIQRQCVNNTVIKRNVINAQEDYKIVDINDTRDNKYTDYTPELQCIDKEFINDIHSDVGMMILKDYSYMEIRKELKLTHNKLMTHRHELQEKYAGA